MLMKGTTLVFKKQIEAGTDGMNNPVYNTQDISVDDCLIAPITVPSNAREQQAMTQHRIQVQIHLPKNTNVDISGSTVEWDDKRFKVDSDNVAFMPENTPTRWNRYFRAEVISG